MLCGHWNEIYEKSPGHRVKAHGVIGAKWAESKGVMLRGAALDN